MKWVSRLQRLKIIRPPLPGDVPIVQSGEGEWVVLLHGLWRSVGAMGALQEDLGRAGYGTANLPYPSMTASVSENALRVRRFLAEQSFEGRVHFVTHSLGGIILRELLKSGELPCTLGRVVMLAPPSNGSEIVDWLGGLGRVTLGPSCEVLKSDGVRPGIPASAEVGVLMGDRSLIPFFRSFLEEGNDGIVSVEKGRLEGMKDFRVLDADHTFMTGDARVRKEVLSFLQNGFFSQGE